MRASRVEIGRIVGAHALRGEVRVSFFGDGPDNLLRSAVVWLARERDDPETRRFDVVRAGMGRGGEVRLGLEGVEDRAAAEALRGLLVLTDEADLEPLEEGELYWHQLVGCRVETEGGVLVGSVRELWATGSHDVLVVDAQDGRQILVPTAREIMTRVDLADRLILIDPIPGLLD